MIGSSIDVMLMRSNYQNRHVLGHKHKKIRVATENEDTMNVG